MRIGVLGTGRVGQVLASRLVELGHDVVMGSRSAGNDTAVAWARDRPERAAAGTFADAAAAGEVVVNATSGVNSLDALRAAGAGNLAGKTLLDVANPLDFSRGFPPRLAVGNDDSLGEQIQREFPDARVVKALNTMTAAVMVQPALLSGDHQVLVAGDNDTAKAQVAELLQGFGWPSDAVVDLGGISAARGMEGYLLLWVTLMSSIGTAEFNIRIVTG